MWHALICYIGITIYFVLRTLTYSPDLGSNIHSQLSDSLSRYNEDGFLIREAWHNLMAGGCCGVDRYWDFSDLGMTIPSVCQPEVPPSYTKKVADASEKTFMSGCGNLVMLHIFDNEERRIYAFLCATVFDMFILLATVCSIKKFCLIKKSKSGLNDKQL